MFDINNSLHPVQYIVNGNIWILNLTINGYYFIAILWNLLLILVPFFLCLYLNFYWRKTKFKKLYHKIYAAIIIFIWLLFIPNTAYVITEVRHLLNFCPVNEFDICLAHAWMILFFFIYAVLGWVAYVYLVNQMRILIYEILGKVYAHIYIWSIIPIISLGMLLGLFNRWNSWEIFFHPAEMIESILIYFLNFSYFLNWLIFTLFMYLLYFGGNTLLKNKFTIKKWYGIFKNK